VKSTTEKLAPNPAEYVVAVLREKSQKDYLRRLPKRLELVEKTFVIPALNPKRKGFLWPRDKDLRDIDQCIFGLAGTLRKKKLLTHTEAILLVDKKWPGLRLRRRLLQLIEAGLGHQNAPLPDVPESFEHFLWIKNLAKGHGPTAELAGRFIHDHELLRARQRRLSQIKWAPYKEILLRRDGRAIAPQCPIPFVSSETSCCARYLEMERDFWLYSHEFEELDRQRQMFGEPKPYFEWLEQNDLRDSGLNALRLARRREAAKKRQARHRKEIRAKKRDKIKGIASDNEQASSNLRDAWHLWESIEMR
jgi:hypothetical protein